MIMTNENVNAIRGFILVVVKLKLAKSNDSFIGNLISYWYTQNVEDERKWWELIMPFKGPRDE